MGYIPICDDLLDRGHQRSIVCFAYPRNRFTNTPAFQGATFSIEIVDQYATETDCLTARSAATEERAGIATIGGMPFAMFDIGDAGMGNSLIGRAYRTFRRGRCYQLGVALETSNVETYDPPVRDLSEGDLNEVNGRLEQALKSFRFLK